MTDGGRNRAERARRSPWSALKAFWLRRIGSDPKSRLAPESLPKFGVLAGDQLSRFRLIASAIVNSDPVIRTYAACEWDDLDENGQAWIEAIITETVRRAEPHLATNLADARRTIASLQQPRIFTVGGLVEQDLAERESRAADELGQKADRLKRELDEAKRRGSSLQDRAWELEKLVRPVRIDELIERRNATTVGVLDDPAEEAEVALWELEQRGRALRLVAELATMTEVEVDCLDAGELRTICALLVVPGEDPPTLPRLYGDEDRQRARDALFRRFHNADKPAVQMVAATTGEIVDLVAEALGMRRA